MDPLSQTIALMRPQALAWRVFEADAPWRIRFPSVDAVVFGQLLEGACAIDLADGTSEEFRDGDFLLMPAPASWSMGTQGSGPETDFKAAIAEPGLLRSGRQGAAVTRFIAGAFVFAAPNADLLGGLLPQLVLIRGADAAAGRLGALLTLLGDEALASRPGRSLVLDRLLEVMLVESCAAPAGRPHPRAARPARGARGRADRRRPPGDAPGGAAGLDGRGAGAAGRPVPVGLRRAVLRERGHVADGVSAGVADET